MKGLFKKNKLLIEVSNLDQDKVYDVKIEPFREKRTKSMNSYYWVLVTELASKFIAHSSKGYIATTNEEILIRCAKDFRKRAIDQLVETSRIYKKLKLKGNLKLVINEENLLVVEE